MHNHEIPAGQMTVREVTSAGTSLQVRVDERGVYLARGDSNSGDALPLYIAPAEIDVLLGLLQQHRAVVTLVPRRWHVSGSVLYDAPDGEECTSEVTLIVEAGDAQEASRTALSQLQDAYAGAAWEETPTITLVTGE